MREYFLKPKYLGANLKVELNLRNYATKADLKNTTGVDTSDFARKTDLANLKSDVDKSDDGKLKNVPSDLRHLKTKVHKLDVDKLVPVPVDLSKLSDAVKNYIAKETEHNKLVKKVNNISTRDTCNLVKRTDYNTKINQAGNKVTTDYNK